MPGKKTEMRNFIFCRKRLARRFRRRWSRTRFTLNRRTPRFATALAAQLAHQQCSLLAQAQFWFWCRWYRVGQIFDRGRNTAQKPLRAVTQRWFWGRRYMGFFSQRFEARILRFEVDFIGERLGAFAERTAQPAD